MMCRTTGHPRCQATPRDCTVAEWRSIGIISVGGGWICLRFLGGGRGSLSHCCIQWVLVWSRHVMRGDE